ncbi:hypothetical protein [Actinoplanes sp. NPDC051411]|uniref:hypothetical protein n=1 Tax=Actinoplanes sp. NPDC051411 TaxID=3155522 RepID=UPI0034127A4D
MPEPKLSLPERALLLILMATNAELSNPEIEDSYAPGLKLTGKSRLKLADAKLIDCRKGTRGAYFFRLADDGWAWCRAELAGESQRQDGSAGKALYAVLGGVGDYLDRTGRSLAQIFADLPEEPPVANEPAAAPAMDAASSSTLPADEIDLEVRRTYRKLADPAGSWVGLADIRDHLRGIPRREVDGVLRLMSRMPGIRIEEETNQKSLSQRDREAAVTIGNRAQHVLSIESA